MTPCTELRARDPLRLTSLARLVAMTAHHDTQQGGSCVRASPA
jgi:hypothetical protein